ncbi:MAG: tRNA lysidine(34) synthetase TilS, partial [Firmicutes bacterium]|nr:tRNA lysidine(34) synthetase TilS [Candidatus Caballimonas caccae]
VALSGGSDSMALLDFMLSESNKYGIKIVAINVEHGIRGEESKSDSNFVKEYCKAHNVPLYYYEIDCLSFAKENSLSLEEGARALRYKCFYNAINEGKCDKVATAHHLNDNFESVLLNLFRGTGIKGLKGIESNFENKIIRPFLTVSKKEIEEYVQKNDIPFVTDSSNFSIDYTRNFLRLNVIPKIKEVFPEAEKSILRLNEIISCDEEYFSKVIKDFIVYEGDRAYIKLPVEKSILSRAVIEILRYLGVKKDWAKTHIDSVFSLLSLNNGSSVDLLNGIKAVREYDRICFYKENQVVEREIPFSCAEFTFFGKQYKIEKVNGSVELKNGFFADLDKIPFGAVIRTKKDGDIFTKFGGGTKKLNDFFTDIKIPKKDRNSIPVLACGNIVYFVFKIAISNLIKVDGNTKNIVQFI